MKYFILEQGKGYDRNPSLKGWHGKIDWHSLKRDGQAVGKRFMFQVSATEHTFYPDIMMHPVFMVSEAVRDIIAIYANRVIFSEVFLLDSERDEGHIYYIPYLPVVDCLHDKEGGMKGRNRQYVVDESKMWNRNIVETETGGSQCIVVSLDFAESILRKGITGIGLKETE